VLDNDAELRLHNQRLRDVYEIGPSDRVLDIGCGSGQTTCEAARLASAEMAHGVDSSAAMIERARHRTNEERLHTVTCQLAAAEACRFPNERFDIAISRFGTMFFNDQMSDSVRRLPLTRPVAAYGSIHGHGSSPRSVDDGTRFSESPATPATGAPTRLLT